MRHPLHHLRGVGIQALRGEGLIVDVLGEDLQSKLFEVWTVFIKVFCMCVAAVYGLESSKIVHGYFGVGCFEILPNGECPFAL